jgi:hypothetical protein
MPSATQNINDLRWTEGPYLNTSPERALGRLVQSKLDFRARASVLDADTELQIWKDEPQS